MLIVIIITLIIIIINNKSNNSNSVNRKMTLNWQYYKDNSSDHTIITIKTKIIICKL